MDLDGVTIRRREDLERTGNWLLARRSLGLSAFGMNLVEIPPGERIPEPASVLIVSAPRNSGYEPMEWA